MNYELAKELKDAGFPLYTQGYTSTELRRMVSEDFVPTSDGQIVPTLPVPTLEELIEACGEIVLWKDRHRGWRAGQGRDRHMESGENYFDDYPDFLETGATPTEAVARLWLALNKN